MSSPLTLAFCLGTLLLPSTVPSPEGDFRVRALNWPDVAFVQTILVETRAHLVVIDPGAAPEHARRISALSDSLGKPLAAVFLTHAHIDHYGALEWLERAGAPLLTSEGVRRQLVEYQERNYARFGRPAPRAPAPTRTLGEGDSLVVDGVRFVLHDAGPGESYADVWLTIEAGGRTAVALGDLVMYGLPPFMQSGRSTQWLASLTRVRALVPANATLFLGHDAAGVHAVAPRRGSDILEWQAKRIEAFRAAVFGITAGRRLLTAAEIDRVVEALHADEPANLEGFDFLITTSANVLAAELIEERAKTEFEASLRAVMTAERW